MLNGKYEKREGEKIVIDGIGFWASKPVKDFIEKVKLGEVEYEVETKKSKAGINYEQLVYIRNVDDKQKIIEESKEESDKDLMLRCFEDAIDVAKVLQGKILLGPEQVQKIASTLFISRKK